MKKKLVNYILIALGSIMLSNCNKQTENQDVPLSFDSSKKLVSDQIISVFENSTPIIQYNYIENLKDGRGFTAGRAGFTTATCDLLEVVNRYTQKVPNNVLASFIPKLKPLCNNNDSSTSGIINLPQAWITAAKDPIFKQMQDSVSDEFYFKPVLAYTQKLSLKYPLSILNLYDACIQHGDGTDLDGLAAMIKRTNQALGGSPTEGVDEKKWLEKFMTIRKNTLQNPANTSTKEVWRESVYRVDALQKIFDEQNFNLKTPLKLVVWGTSFILPQ